ncbi:MAG: insulinase family protein [Deltaproteobacteria bacterium]|nr:insulinase family protein [Deltaproteobacteria bacterium]
MRFFKCLFFGLFLALLASGVSLGQGPVSNIKLDVKEFRLENGMLFLIVERPIMPQVACRIAIRAGSALEEAGKTGIAHMLEHMMFKGTKNFGTLDFKTDRDLQGRIEEAYQVVSAEQKKRHPDQSLIKAKLAEMDRLRLEVQEIYVPQAFSSQLGKNGAVGVNAFTSKDQTQYIASVPSDMLEQWFSIISEQLFEPSWREFYVEKEVVQREWAFRYVNKPQGAAWLDLGTTAYTAHPYRNPVIGWKSDMEKYNTRDAMRFHKKYYNPTNAVCVLVGDVTVEDAKRLANVYFKRYPEGKRAAEEVTKEPAPQGPRKSVRFLKGARTPLVRIGFHSARMGDRDFYGLDAMTMVLSSGRGARMTQNIVNKGLAVQAWAGNPDNRYAGMVILGGSPNEPDELKRKDMTEEERRQVYLRACEGLEKILLDEVEKLKTEPVTTSELERIKKLNQRDFLDRMRSNEGLAGTLATLEVQAGWQYMTTYLKNIAEVTPEDIREAAKKYIRTDNKTSVYVIPGGIPDRPPEQYAEVRSVKGSSAAKGIKTDSSVNNSDYSTPKDWKHPLSFERRPEKIEYEKAETAAVEGAKVFYLPDRELPLIDLTLLIKAGSVDVGNDKAGLCGVLNSCLIRGGTEKYSPAELAMILDENAIRMSASFGSEVAVITLSVMKDDWDKGLDLLEEVITRPRFDADVLKVSKTKKMTFLKRQGGNARAVARREARIWHFAGHPYGRDPLKELKTIPAITRDDLTGFLKKYVMPSNMVAAVAGDIDKTDAIKGLEKLFRALPKGKAPERRLEDPKKTPPVLAFINKPGQVQSQVGMMLASVKRTNPDYWKMRLLMDIFGGSDSLMYTRLRADLGLVYSAWFYETYKWRAGMLIGYIGCKGEKTARAIEETVKIMHSVRKNVPSNDLEQKRLDALNSFVFNVDTPDALVNAYGRYYMRKEPLNTLEMIQDAYITARREELESLAKKFLDPQKLQIFVVGDKTTRVQKEDGSEVTLEEDIKRLAKKLDLPYREIELR